MTLAATLGTINNREIVLFSVILIVLSYAIPFQFKRRSENALFQAIALPVGFLLLHQIINQVAAAINGSWKLDLSAVTSMLQSVMEGMLGQTLAYPYLATLTPAIVSITLSIWISNILFRKKEL